MSHTEQLRNLMNLMESIESKGPSEEEVTAAREKAIQLISQEDGSEEEQLDEVNWKKALGGAALAGALATGAGAGVGDAKAQSVGDFMNLAGQVAKVAQAASGDSNRQVQAPRAQAQPQQAQQAPRQQAQQSNVHPAVRAANAEDARERRGMALTGRDLIDASSDPTFIGSCQAIALEAMGAVNPSEAKRFHDFLDTVARRFANDPTGKSAAQWQKGRENRKAALARDVGNQKAIKDAFYLCKSAFK